VKIRQIDLYNFRQFYGTTRLALACEEDRNVTLIHGEKRRRQDYYPQCGVLGDVRRRNAQIRAEERIVNLRRRRKGSRGQSRC